MGLGDLWKTLRASKLVHYESDHLESCKRKNVKKGLLTVTLDDLLPGYKLSSSGSNMLLFWDVLGREKLEIWCAEISLERRRELGQIWGNIEWSEAIITLDPPPPHHLHCKILLLYLSTSENFL
ncbi:putative F-box/kelch-repeat protein [Cardamine amara subsp. amara]|uniref:F-box/kelch-repeat protein n=1 Tax=Cardamine amara subsp. amara TaxID=228776 RepID=A0ABD1A099_CARAN